MEAYTPPAFTDTTGIEDSGYLVRFTFNLNDGVPTKVIITDTVTNFYGFDPMHRNNMPPGSSKTTAKKTLRGSDIEIDTAAGTATVRYLAPTAFNGHSAVATLIYTLKDINGNDTGTGTVKSKAYSVSPSYLYGTEMGSSNTWSYKMNGDIIVVEDFRGVVVRVSIRTTIQDDGGNLKIINNSDIRNVQNRSCANSLALVNVSIGYNADLVAAEKFLNAELSRVYEEHKDILLDCPVYCGVQDLAASSADLRVKAEVTEGNIYVAQRLLRRELKLILDNGGIEIPFPQIVVHQEKSSPFQKARCCQSSTSLLRSSCFPWIFIL